MTRIEPRALMVPPGLPRLHVARRGSSTPGAHVLDGRAWSGWAPVAARRGQHRRRRHVGRRRARPRRGALGVAAPGPTPGTPCEPGTYVLCCRATDAAGNVQPVDQPWNRQGMANNLVQRVPVVVREAGGSLPG